MAEIFEKYLPLNCKRLDDERRVKMEKMIDCSLDTDRPAKLPALYIFSFVEAIEKFRNTSESEVLTHSYWVTFLSPTAKSIPLRN